MGIVVSLTRIVNLSERCFSSTPDVVVVSVELKPNLSSHNLASIIFSMALVKDCWKLVLIKEMHTTFSVPHSSSCWEKSCDIPIRWLNTSVMSEHQTGPRCRRIPHRKTQARFQAAILLYYTPTMPWGWVTQAIQLQHYISLLF